MEVISQLLMKKCTVFVSRMFTPSFHLPVYNVYKNIIPNIKQHLKFNTFYIPPTHFSIFIVTDTPSTCLISKEQLFQIETMLCFNIMIYYMIIQKQLINVSEYGWTILANGGHYWLRVDTTG